MAQLSGSPSDPTTAGVRSAQAIDVPEEDKRFVMLETGHVPEWNDVIRYTLEWLDERLGPAGGRD